MFSSMVIGTTIWIIYSNNIKQEQLRASDRIEHLFDEISAVEDIQSDVDYVNAENKLNEAKQLMEQNKLNDKYKNKYDELISYINDLQSLRKIIRLCTMTDEKSFLAVNQEIEKLTCEKVIIRAAAYSLDFSAKKFILAKCFDDAQKSLLNSHPGWTIKSAFYYIATSENPYDYTYTDYGLVKNAIGVNEYCDTFTKLYDNTDMIATRLSAKSKSNIKNNGKHGICIESIDENRKNWVTYWYVGFDVKSIIKKGGVIYEVTKYTEGEPSTQSNLTFNDLKNYNVGSFPS